MARQNYSMTFVAAAASAAMFCEKDDLHNKQDVDQDPRIQQACQDIVGEMVNMYGAAQICDWANDYKPPQPGGVQAQNPTCGSCNRSQMTPAQYVQCIINCNP